MQVKVFTKRLTGAGIGIAK